MAVKFILPCYDLPTPFETSPNQVYDNDVVQVREAQEAKDAAHHRALAALRSQLQGIGDAALQVGTRAIHFTRFTCQI